MHAHRPEPTAPGAFSHPQALPRAVPLHRRMARTSRNTLRYCRAVWFWLRMGKRLPAALQLAAITL